MGVVKLAYVLFEPFIGQRFASVFPIAFVGREYRFSEVVRATESEYAIISI
jgi:hypothetical protein